MRKARLIKKADLAERRQRALSQQAYLPRQSASGTQATLKQWVGAYQSVRRPDPRAAFAALFAAGA